MPNKAENVKKCIFLLQIKLNTLTINIQPKMRTTAILLTFLFFAIIPTMGAVNHIATPMKGDLNGDGSLSINDVTLLVEIILQNKEAGSTADMNGDGEVNITDVSLLISAILGSNNNGPHTQDEDANPNLPVLAPKGK